MVKKTSFRGPQSVMPPLAHLLQARGPQAPSPLEFLASECEQVGFLKQVSSFLAWLIQSRCGPHGCDITEPRGRSQGPSAGQQTLASPWPPPLAFSLGTFGFYLWQKKYLSKELISLMFHEFAGKYLE